MKTNVLKFQKDIKIQVAKQKETGDCDWWMHPVYCAYYILKHGMDQKNLSIKHRDIVCGWGNVPRHNYVKCLNV